MEVETRGYAFDQAAGPVARKRFKALGAVLGVWNSRFSIWARTGAAESERVVRSNLNFSRTRYLVPAGKRDYVEGNSNGDFAASGRGDYSVRLLSAGVTPGVSLGQWQEVAAKVSLRTMAGRYVQLRIRNEQGRLQLRAAGPSASEGIRRGGVLI